MDLEGSELTALEERLYSSIHHSFDESANQDGDMQWQQSFVGATSTPSRVVSSKSVVNNNIQPRASKMKRYWAPNTPQQPAHHVRSFARDQPEAQTFPKSAPQPVQAMTANPRPQPGTQQLTSIEQSTGDPKRTLIAPYQSLLSSWQLQRNPGGTDSVEGSPASSVAQSPATKEKKRKKKQPPKHSVEKRLASLVSLVEGGDQKEGAKQRIQVKKSKATTVRNKLADKAGSKQRIVAEISLDSSEDETRPPSRTAKLKPSSVPPSDDDTTDVELIPAPPPPKICIDCSDDEVAQDSFVLPKSKRTKKKKAPKNASSPRCLSPSNSSIMSDDFIGHNDRSRLNDSFTESIANDYELETECSLREPLQVNRKSRSVTKERNKRVPSVSSDGTIGTASDVTDQDKRANEETSGGKTPKKVVPPTPGSATDQADELSGGNAQLGKPSQNGQETVLKTKGKPKKSAAANTMVRSKSHSPASHGTIGEDQMMEEQNATVKAATVEQHPLPKGKTKSKNKTKQSFSAEGTDTAAMSSKAGKTTPKRSLRSKNDMESESMYNEISKIGNKSKKDTVCYDDSSISSESDYNVTLISTKSSANPTESRKGGSGNEAANTSTVLDRMEDVSSESDIEEFLQRSSSRGPTVSAKTPSAESAKTSKKRSTGTKRRKKYNSENLSDEEFACMLTDIVQAVSDGDDDDDDDDDEDDLEVENQNVEQTPTQAAEQDASASVLIAASPQPSPEQQQPATEEKGKKKKRRKVAATADCATTVTLSDTDDDVLEISDVNEVMDDSLPNATLMAAGTTRPGWNREMDLFYNSSKTESQFCMRRVMEDMPREADQWKIIDKDRYPDPPKRGKPCHNCGEQGHMRYKCQNAPKPLVCRICGKQGHHEPRCPMTICLNCGNRTRSFVYECGNCRPNLRKKCHICGIIGHCATMCPDNWRRYHSTTEENVPLVQKFKRNNNAKQCSICGRTNHQAHNCYVPARIFSCPIPSELVYSYRPIYPYDIGRRKSCPPEVGSRSKQSDVQAVQQETEVSSRNCEASSCELNLEALEANNPNGFYHRFLQTMDLHQEQSYLGDQVIVTETKVSESDEHQQHRGLRVFQRNKKPKIDGHSSSVAGPTASDQQKETPFHVKEEPDTVLEGEEAVVPKDDNVGPMVTLPEASITEDSNYSFSELMPADGEGQVSTAKITIPTTTPPQPQSVDANSPKDVVLDFIPLSGPSEQADCNVDQATSIDESLGNKTVELAIANQPTSTAKICLSKENAKLLLSLPGQEFLQLAKVKHEVTLMITFELVGNVLHVGGSAAQQDAFRAELVQFLKDQELAAYNKKMISITCVPKKSRKAVQHITLFFEQLLKPFDNVKLTFNRYISALKNGRFQLHMVEKVRKTLNLVLFGVYGMREGRSRMNQLVKQVAELKKNQPKEELDPSLRQSINEHIVYIFSPYDHGDYNEIFTEFERLDKLHQLKKITCVELGLPDRKFSNISLYPMVKDDEADTTGNDEFASQFVEIVNPQKTREYNENLMKRHKVPSLANKLALRITIHFKRLIKSFDSVKNMFHRYVRLQQEVIQSKEVEVARTNLNMVLFGVYGMREGRKRMSQLIQAAGTFKNSTENIEPSSLKTINENLAYIFSSYDHGNYTKIVAEYQQLRKQQRLTKITAKEMGLKGRISLTTPHHCFPTKNINKADDFDEMEGSNQKEEEDNDDDNEDDEDDDDEGDAGDEDDKEVVQQQELQQPSNPNGDHDPTEEPLILNTFDQMIDPQRLEWLDRASRCHGDQEDYQMPLQLPQLVENLLFSNYSIAPAPQRQQQQHYQQYQHQPQHYQPNRFESMRAASNRADGGRGGYHHRDDRQRSNAFKQPNSQRSSPKWRQIMAEQEEKILRCLRLAHCNKGMRHLTDRIDFISRKANKGPLRPIERAELDRVLHILSNKRQPTQATNRGRRFNAHRTPNYRHSY